METLRCLNFACSLLVKSTNASLLHSMVLTQRLNKSAVTKEKEHVRVTKVWCGAWDTKGYITKAPKVNALRSNGQAVATRVCTLIFLSTKALKMGTEWGIHCCKQTCANKATSRTRRATIHKNSLHAAATSLTLLLSTQEGRTFETLRLELCEQLCYLEPRVNLQSLQPTRRRLGEPANRRFARRLLYIQTLFATRCMTWPDGTEQRQPWL